jgi:hypothetical protein
MSLMPPTTIDYGALGALERVVGFLLALATAISLTWVVERGQRIAPADEFKQARRLANLATAVFIALIFVFMASSARLVALGTTAAGGVIGCVVFFLWNVWTRLRPQQGSGRVIAYLGTFILYIVCGSVGLAASALLLYVVRANPENHTGAPPEGAQAYGVQLVLVGQRAVSVTGTAKPFRASSGQVNFGCEQTVTAQATWDAPPESSLEGEIRAEWTNLANAKSYSATAAVEGGRVVGSGTISGLDLQRLPFGISNCPGGGHGEVVLSGAYVTRDTGQQPFIQKLVGRLAAQPPDARRLALTLPSEGDVTLKEGVVELRRGDALIDRATVPFGAAPQADIVSERRRFSVARSRDGLVVELMQ